MDTSSRSKVRKRLYINNGIALRAHFIYILILTNVKSMSCIEKTKFIKVNKGNLCGKTGPTIK